MKINYTKIYPCYQYYSDKHGHHRDILEFRISSCIIHSIFMDISVAYIFTENEYYFGWLEFTYVMDIELFWEIRQRMKSTTLKLKKFKDVPADYKMF